METLKALHEVSAIGAAIVTVLWLTTKFWPAVFRVSDFIKQKARGNK